MSSFYNRAKAMEFAAEFWDRPCRSDKHPFAIGLDSARDVPLSAVWDQRKAPSSDFEPRFVFNPQIGRDQLIAVPKPGSAPGLKPVPLVEDITVGKKLEDCAHFLSQCLKAGGLRIAEQWSVPMLVNALRAGEDLSPRPTAKTLAEKVSRATAQRIIDADLLTVGDMIGYFNDGGYSHCAMFTGKQNGVGRVTCHTKSRFVGMTPAGVTDEWFLVNPNYLFTLMHIPRNSESISGLGAKFAGWWRVARGQQTEHYFLRADGRAIRTANAPKTTKAPRGPSSGDSPGYWFESSGKIKICWRKDGSLATMDPPVSGKPTRLMVEGMAQALATRPGGN